MFTNALFNNSILIILIFRDNTSDGDSKYSTCPWEFLLRFC